MSEAFSAVLRGFLGKGSEAAAHDVGDQRFRYAKVGGNCSDGFTGCVPGADLVPVQDDALPTEHLSFSFCPPQASNDVNRPVATAAVNNDVHKTAALADTTAVQAISAASTAKPVENAALPVDLGPNGKTIDVP